MGNASRWSLLNSDAFISRSLPISLVRCYTAGARKWNGGGKGAEVRDGVGCLDQKLLLELKRKGILLSLFMALNTAKRFLIAKCCAL